ncbi:serine--tRNA ligase [uncultured Sphingomonas sp.]|uniref:serine--tRNA ligase n=1 Tax=uncultured Sphingomonas sp. TaxID=158754 RepID=UPI002638CFC7|nr:serine--tRNA ligase [uncultured Sphingomonas sp.]
MHDIRLIRDDPAAFDAAMKKRGLAPLSADLLAIDERARALTTEVQAVLARRNEASKAIGAAKARRDDPTDLMAEVAALKERLPELEAEQKAVATTLAERLASIPNVPADDVPVGADESGNVEQKRWGTPRTFTFAPKEHADLGPALGMDFETGARLSGARFTFLRGGMARLHRALAQFMLDRQVEDNGYVECNPPVMVGDAAMYGTDKLPKFADDSFRTTDGRWLIPTSEVSLTASVADRILGDLAEPMRMTAHTLCFRSEAGAAGRDTRGFIRQHQFEKVELVTVCRPDDSDAEHERMTRCAEGILEALDLPYRRLLLCTGDMGFGARRTYDLEVWLPGQDAWREISSCSTTGDFQARRMNARYRPEGEKGTRFVHTLNGSGLAVGRTLVAVLENYQQEDGSVAVPAVLQPYMGGVDRLSPR